MRRGTAGQNPPETFMFADYVGGNSAAQYPNGRALHCTEGPGWSHSIQQANPGAGADWTLTMAAGQRALPKSFTAQLLTSGVAGNRNIELIIDDGANVVWRASAPASVIAGTTQQLSGATTNSPTGVVTTDFSVVIPPNLFLEPGWRVRTATTGILDGDQWSNIWFGVEEWIESF